jgi:3-isopropylmalate/(R)-2-methylmalate dehydratase small subunit
MIRPRIERITSRLEVLLHDDIDTDRIIPGRFLTVTERGGLGAHLFADFRHEAPGPRLKGDGAILLVGANFGCGSSREHAAWALKDAGFQAVVARSFADIFRANALKNGLLPVALAEPAHRAVVEARLAEPALAATVDVAAGTLALPGRGCFGFPLDPFARRCLIEGLDELAYLLSKGSRIAAWEERHG